MLPNYLHACIDIPVELSQLWEARYFCRKIYVCKLYKMPDFTTFAPKIEKMPKFYMIFGGHPWPLSLTPVCIENLNGTELPSVWWCALSPWMSQSTNAGRSPFVIDVVACMVSCADLARQWLPVTVRPIGNMIIICALPTPPHPTGLPSLPSHFTELVQHGDGDWFTRWWLGNDGCAAEVVGWVL